MLLATGGRHLWSEEDEGSQRAALFKGAKVGSGKAHPAAQPGVRTAEDIKAAYGRPSTAKRCACLRLLSALQAAVLAGSLLAQPFWADQSVLHMLKTIPVRSELTIMQKATFWALLHHAYALSQDNHVGAGGLSGVRD